ncbi:MAG: type II secretion system minor pseudopilin GspK [Succinivibrionaceae bacterium]|nr:type II secretion system minor pseudopilin GspK [Succinivibrionaceae bacterium]
MTRAKGPKARGQRGSALLVVLLILSVMVIVATNMTMRYNSEFLRTANFVNGIQAKWYAKSSDSLVRRVLHQDFSDNPDSINTSQYWSTEGRTYDIEGGLIATYVYDDYSCFNLNALANHGYDISDETGTKTNLAREMLIRLMLYMQIQINEAEEVADSITDMVDSDTSISRAGAEDSYYMSLAYPFVIPNTRLYNVSEIRVAKGMTASIYRRLKPFVCALQTNELHINVNTVTEPKAPLLAALMLSEYMTVETALEMIKSRDREGWTSVSNFLKQEQVENMMTERTKNFISGVVAVNSKYFHSETEVEFNGFTRRFFSYFVRNNKDAILYKREYGGAE